MIERLLTEAAGRDGAIVVGAHGREQPLVGVYRTACLRERLKDIDGVGGASIKVLVSGLGLARVEDERAALDCDSPEDLAALEREL